MLKSITPLIYFNCLLVIGFIITICPYSISQKAENIDSLIQVANKTPDDTNKVDLLIKIGTYYFDIYNLPETRKFLFKALAIGEKINFKEGLVKSNNLIGRVFRSEENYREALRYQENALKIAEQTGNKSLVALSYYDISMVYQKMENDSTAIHYLLKGLNIAGEARDKVRMIRIYNSLGLIYDFNGDYPNALKHYLSSLKIAEEIGEQYGIGAANVNIGIVHSYTNDYEAYLRHNLAAAKIWKETGHKKNLADAYTNIGEAYANILDTTEAEKYTLLGINLAKEIKYNPALGAGLTKLGIIASTKGNYRAAVKYYLESLKVWESEGNHFKIAATQIFIGKGYADLNQNREAISYFKKALTLTEKINSKFDRADALKFLSHAEAKLGNYKDALIHYQSHVGIMDSIFSANNVQQMAKLKEEYESEKKEKEIEILNKEKGIHKLQLKQHIMERNYFIISLALVLILSFLAYKYYNNRQEVKLLTIRNKIAIDLHDDVGSTLSSISMFSQMAQSQSKEHIPALETIEESSRKMLEAMADIVWSIKPENDLFEKVIMHMREFAYQLLGTKQIEFEFDADDDISKINLPMETRKNLYLIFKEATNNMAKYSKANNAKFALKGENDKLTMVISDDGKGFDTTKDSRGNGLENMKRRALEIGAKLLIDSAPGNGTTIRLELAV